MNNENTAATQALEASGPEVESRLAVRPDWSPEKFQQDVERETAMRHIMQDYMQKAMKPGHHFYSFKEGDKPAITQEGAHAICSLMKCTIGRPELNETYHDDGHLSVRSRVSIYNQQGNEVATGDGICSTRESKYAYRWVWDNEIAKGQDVSQLKSKTGPKKGGGTWTQYQMPNQDLPDLYNTVLKMAVKRAKVAAVRQLPLVSELFLDDSDEDTPPPAPKTQNQKPKAEQPKASVVDNVVALSKKLIERGVEAEDLAMQFLPEGVATFAELTEDQALTVQPSMVELLNAKIKG